jgi:intein/homing endonuclease
MPDIWIGRSEEDRKKFGDKGLIYIGKLWVRMENLVSLSNPVYLDLARSHVIMICGKRGSGKCVTGDTLIPVSDGSLVPIEELAQSKREVFGLDDKLKITCFKPNGFFEREVDKILHIKLRSGREIKLTPEHPLLTIKGWKPAKELGVGSRIATARKIECFGNQQMPEHEIKLLAYLIAEGHLENRFVLFTNSDEEIIKEFCSCIKEFDANLEIKRHGKYGYRVVQKNKKIKQHVMNRDEKGRFSKGSGVRYEKSSLRLWLEKLQLYGKRASQKFIPQEIFRLPKNQLALFLNRLFSCDGSIYSSKNHYEISYASSSEKLIKQIQHLLLRFGILSKLRKKQITLDGKTFSSFELTIEGENILKFIDEIGFYGKKKEKESEVKLWLKTIKPNPNVDTIPKEIWEIYRPENWAKIGRALGYKYPKAMREKIKYCPSRQMLLQIAQVENHKGLYLLATSDIFWDEIVAIELLEGKFKVYDLSIPEFHNFVANDIIVHNSYTLGVIAEGITDMPEEVKNNIAPLIFDTMGIYWSMAYRNDKEIELLRQWQLKPKNLPVRIFVPYAYFDEFVKRGIGKIQPFALDVNDITHEDWLITFGLSYNDPVGITIQKVIIKLKEKGERYDIDDIIDAIKSDEEAERQHKLAAINLFNAAKAWGIFASKNEKPTSIAELLQAGITTVLDLSMYSSVGAYNVRALAIGLICKKIFNERMLARKLEEVEAVRHGMEYLYFKEKQELPLVWIFIDEMHEFLPKDEKTPASDALIQLLREGRQPGISLVFATQQPGKLHTDAITQADIIISHRLTAKPDLDALSEIMQTYLAEDIIAYLNQMPRYAGSALVLDDNSERMYMIRIRPRFTWHGGEAPTAVKVEKRE